MVVKRRTGLKGQDRFRKKEKAGLKEKLGIKKKDVGLKEDGFKRYERVLKRSTGLEEKYGFKREGRV